MDMASSKVDSISSIDTVSLGMVVIDEIRLPSRPPLLDVIGGSGAYATLGSRLFATPTHSKKIGCLVLAGHDLPEAVKEPLLTWQTTMQLNVLQGRLSTRGLLDYQDDTFGPKRFHYITEPLKPSPASLVGTALLGSKAFHLLATPADVEEQIPELLRLRKQHGIEQRPFVELSALFETSFSIAFQPSKLEAYASEFCKSTGTTGDGIVVVRSAEHGSLTTKSAAEHMWLPPYYQVGAAEVIDPTGGGNAFLGGFIAGWNVSKDILEASVYGNVAASFAIEQIGLPSCRTRNEAEIWNGVGVMERLAEYKARLKSLKSPYRPA